MSNVAAGAEHSLRNHIETYVFDCRKEGMLWVVTMFGGAMAWNAQVVILAGLASDKAGFWKF